MKARTRLVVLSQFQKWFLISFVGYTMLFLGVFLAGLIMYFRLVGNELIQMGGLLSSTFLEQIEKHLLWGGIFMAVLLVVLLGLAAYYALLFSRRIAGPIFALSRHLDRCIEEKELSPLKLRDDDLFREVADKFNTIVAERVGGKK